MKKITLLIISTIAVTVMNLPAQIVITAAGEGTGGFNGDGGKAISSQLNNPYAIATDSYRNVYIADRSNNRIRKITASNGIITTVAGNGMFGYSGDGGQATAAKLAAPFGVAVDAFGNIYISDCSNNCIRKVSSTGVISTYAGNTYLGYAGDGGPATAASLAGPVGLSLDLSGNLYIADNQNHCIRMVHAANGIIYTVAGNASQGFGGDGNSATGALLNSPTGVTIDASGNMYIADYGNNRIRVVSGGIIHTIAGNGIAAFNGDGGNADTTALYHPWSVAVNAGKVFIADYANQRIRVINTTGIMATVIGTGMATYSGDCFSPVNAQVKYPAGIAFDHYGNLYIADNGNNRIRKVLFSASEVIVNGQVSQLKTCSGNAITFNGKGANSYTWTNGIIDGTPYSVPIVTAMTILNCTVTGTDTNSCSASSVVSLTVNPLPTISVSNSTICIGQSAVLTAALNSKNLTNAFYLWTGGIMNGVAFSPTVTSSYMVVGTDGNGCNATATAMVTVIPTNNPLPVINFSVSPITSCATSATITASGASTYTWSNGVAGANVVVTPSVTTTYSVTGTSQGCTVSASVIQPVSIINISSLVDTLCLGGTTVLTASGLTSYTWTNPSGIKNPSVSVSPTVTTTYSVVGSAIFITVVNGISDTIHCKSANTFTQLVSANCIAGIEQQSDNNFIHIFPNPGNGQITVFSNALIEEMKVFNELGQLIYTEMPAIEKVHLNIDESGVYFIYIRSGKDIHMQKLMVQM